MLKKVPFKLKIFILIIGIILITVFTSVLSVNHFISSYISKNDSHDIETNLNLLKDIIINDINNDINLVKNLNFSLIRIKPTLESTGYLKIIKVGSGFVFDKDGNIEDKEESLHYINQLNSANGKIIVSDILYDGDTPFINIIVPRKQGEGDIFFISLESIKKTIMDSAVPGSYIELSDASNNILFSNKQKGDYKLIPISFDVGGKQWNLKGYIDNAYIQEHTNDLNRSITIALLIAAVIIIPLSYFLIGVAFRPITSLRKVINDLAEGSGDLTQRLKVDSQDELGSIADGINRFIASLQNMMLEISSSSQDINSQICKLEAQSKSSHNLLGTHTKEMEMAIVSVNEMSSTAHHVADNASRAAKQTNQTNDETEQSKLLVQQAVTDVTNLVSEVDNTFNTVQIMAKDTEQISNVLKVIGEIADQTNLLALNAAIEAARAGEMGRGFAVVADEVRALSGRTRQSTLEITDMLDKLKGGSDVLVSSMGATKESCEKSASTTSSVMSSLDVVSDSVNIITDVSFEIAASAKQQSTVTEEMNKNMTEIQKLVLSLSKNDDATLSTANNLTESNQKLVSIVNQFQLK